MRRKTKNSRRMSDKEEKEKYVEVEGTESMVNSYR